MSSENGNDLLAKPSNSTYLQALFTSREILLVKTEDYKSG